MPPTSAPRSLQAGLSAAAGIGTTLLVQVAAIPLVIRAVGVDGFAAFQLCTSLLPWFTIAALGQDRALKNALATAPPEDRPGLKAGVARYVFPRALAIGLLGSAVAAVALPRLGATGQVLTPLAAGLAAAAMAACSYLAIVREALFAEDRGALANWVQAGAMALVAVGIGALAWAPPADQAVGLTIALLAWFGPQALAWVLAARPAGMPLARLGVGVPQAGGLGFVAASYLVLACLSVDMLVMAPAATPLELVHYGLYVRVVSTHSMIAAAFLAFAWVRWTRDGAPASLAWLWPAALAAATGTLIVTAVALEPIAAVLGVPGLRPDAPILAALGAVLLLRTAGECLSTIFFARGRTRAFLGAGALQALVTVAGQVAAVELGWGAAGVLAASALGWSVLCAGLLRLGLRADETAIS